MKLLDTVFVAPVDNWLADTYFGASNKTDWKKPLNNVPNYDMEWPLRRRAVGRGPAFSKTPRYDIGYFLQT